MERVAGEIEQAQRSLDESVALTRQSGSKPALAASLHSLGCALRGSAPAEALAVFSESLGLAREMDDPNGVAYCFEGAAPIFATGGIHCHASSLLAAASRIRSQFGDPRELTDRADADAVALECQRTLTPNAFVAAWEEGVALDANAAVDWALEIWEHARARVLGAE
jgi:hypothetical protein